MRTLEELTQQKENLNQSIAALRQEIQTLETEVYKNNSNNN